MLLNFTTSNYKSFLNEVSLSMVAAPKQKDLDYSINEIITTKGSSRVLTTSVLYGPNASGKTNIIGALDTFLTIIKRGHIRNETSIESPNIAKYQLELIPNRYLQKKTPTTFMIEFILENKRIKYEMSIDIGLFLNDKNARKINFEKLSIDEKNVFERTESTYINHKYDTQNSTKKEQSIIDSIVHNSLVADELFLTNGFKNIVNPKLALEILLHLQTRFDIIYRADSLSISPDMKKNKNIGPNLALSNLSKAFGACNSDALGYASRDKDQDAKLVSVIDQGKTTVAIDSEIFESYGTVRFLNIFPLLKNAIDNGTTLIIDEFDASIHPMILINIVNVFHNDEINKNGAQLIFNTHNPIFLNSSILRRDEIKFVEYDEDLKTSTIYALSDFGTSGDTAVRKTEDYMKNYFINKYGALRNVDLSDYFKNGH